MKFRPTEFLNTPYRVSCYIKLYRKLFSVMRPLLCMISNVYPGSGLLVWVKVVSVTDGTSYNWDASPLFLTRWQHTMSQWYQVCVVILHFGYNGDAIIMVCLIKF